MEEKINLLLNKITTETQERLKKGNLGCESNLKNAIARIGKIGNKYIYIDVGSGGKYMIDKKDSKIYGIKAYGQINKHNSFGTLDTIDNYYWGHYNAILK